jgi:four helix bundle protein
MPEIESYRDLLVWEQAMDLAASVYRLTRGWPKEELYGLTSQALRAATSVPANIAEGYGRENRGSYLQFLKIAQGSLRRHPSIDESIVMMS